MVDIRIPYKKDSEERERNVDMCLKNWYDLGFTPLIDIVKGEPTDLFHRTKSVNKFLNDSMADICIFCDCDCLILERGQIDTAIDLASIGFPLIIPYSMTWNVTPEQFEKRERVDRMGVDGMSYGGIVIFNRMKYLEYGGDNVKMIGWGNEDFERFERIKKLHGHVPRVDGDMWHLKHPRVEKLDMADINNLELQKIKAMPKDELLKYIGEWK